MPNPVVHFEIHGDSAEKRGQFLKELFGWHVEAMPMPEGTYHIVDTHAGGGINGGLSDGPKQFSMFYVAVADLQATLDKAEKLGGKTVMPPVEIPNVVTLAQFSDPQGNLIGLVLDGPDGPGVSDGSNPSLGYFEIYGPEPKKLFSFYKDLFGWHVSESEMPGGLYGEIDSHTEGKGIGGGIAAPQDKQARVVLWASVDDLDKYLERAESLGSKKLMGPEKVQENLSIAMFADPQGQTFGLFKYSA